MSVCCCRFCGEIGDATVAFALLVILPKWPILRFAEYRRYDTDRETISSLLFMKRKWRSFPGYMHCRFCMA